MDPQAPAPALPLTPAQASGDQPQASSPDAAAADKAARKAGPRTAARAPKSASARPGARPRRSVAADAPAAPKADVHVVMLTSRISDVDGRFVARRRVARGTADRVADLLLRGLVREATAEEAAVGDAAPVLR